MPEDQSNEFGALETVIPRDDNQEIRQRFDECAAGPFEFEGTMMSPNGLRTEMRWTGTCEITPDAKYMRGLMQNITELRRLERELAAAQKLESVGRLAAGVAHEINTPVQFVSDNVQFVRTSMTEINAVIHAYRNLRQAVQSAGDVAAAVEAAAAAETAADLDYIVENAPLALDSAIDGSGPDRNDRALDEGIRASRSGAENRGRFEPSHPKHSRHCTQRVQVCRRDRHRIR